ncbi:DUF2523 family protein [Delftia sp.]|uniref:DUF2523 family protein n=1 Tax=Delftia sp. TaxID=1886637 RepID=UPI000373CF76|nr:DUF2523 family protein [Delftia sp.]MPT53178.1 DUF2523 domain-containing protein [Delftia sp.]
MLPAFVGSIGGVLLSLTAGFVGRTLAALGLSLITYYGVSKALNFLKDMIISSLSGLPGEVVQLLGLAKVGTALTILFSCMFASMLLNGLNSDSFKKLIIT